MIGGDNQNRLFDAGTGSPAENADSTLGSIGGEAVICQNAMLLLAIANDGSPTFWTIVDGRDHKDAHNQGGRLVGQPVACNADGSRVVTVDRGITKLWDGKSGALIGELGSDRSSRSEIVFAPNGKRLLMFPYSGLILVDAENGSIIPTPVSDFEYVTNVSFSADSSLIVVPNTGFFAQLIDSNSGSEIVALKGHEDQVNSGVFSTDRLWVLTSSLDKTARLWRIFPSTPALVGYAKAIVPRCLTQDQRRQYFLDADPPRWCITGSAREWDANFAEWQGKWPYHTREWQEWLRARDRGDLIEMPKTAFR
jgi:WD40 repeat protein